MVRPRLVEEGKPIAAFREDDHQAMETEQHTPVAPPPPPPAAVAVAAPPVAAAPSSAPSSSLLRALGGKLPASKASTPPRRSFRVVIGGDDDQMEEDHHHHHHHDAMEDDSDGDQQHHHNQPAIPYNATVAMAPPHQSPHSPLHQHQHRHEHHGTTTRRTRFEIGVDERPTQRMTGVEDHSTPLPLIVVDGANVAYAYAHAKQEAFHGSGRVEPDVVGLRVVCAYFAALRVRVVLPASFMRAKPRVGDSSLANAHMESDAMEILAQLQQQGKLVAAPPADDDDAYCLTIAQRENVKAQKLRQGQAPAFVLSNDMFRDAQDRDTSGQLREWLNHGDRPDTGPGRISFAFCDLGQKDDYGDPIFDLVPNPRHPLVQWIEEQHKHQPH